MIKKRLFLANDASFIGTGYGVYGKELLTRFHNSDKYEVAELGCYADISNPSIKDIPWKFYPNAVSVGDKRVDQYKENSYNQFGAWRFNRCLLDFKPHIVFDIRDYWMYSYQEISPLKKYYHWVLMPTVDSAPQKTEWLYTFCLADIIVPYTEWAKKILTEDCGSKIKLFPKVANAGINPDEFYPIEDKESHKKNFLGQNYNVIGLVMRNQKRKLIPDILLAYKKYLEHLKQTDKDKYHNTILYLHTSYPEEVGWDIPSLLLEYNLIDRVYFTYSCKKCDHYYAAKFKGSITQCPNCSSVASAVVGVNNSISTDKLNKIYNLFDIFVQYAICEGFGMPQIEAASCGIPIVSVDYSAMTEVVDNLQGFKIPVDRTFRELETNANRVYPNIDSTVEVFVKFFSESEQYRAEKSRTTRELCLQRYTWDSVYKVWEECFDSIDITKKIDWKDPQESKTDYSRTVPNGLGPRDFVKYICDSIIMEPSLFYTGYCQGMVRDLTALVGVRNGSIASISYKDAVKKLDTLLQNKINLESSRLSNDLITEDFITWKNK